MLTQAKLNCDRLWVGLQVDPSIDRPEKNKPIQSIYERFVQISALRSVDRVIPYDTESSLLDILKAEPINIRFVGEEYKDREFTGHDLGIEVFYTDRKHSFSSSELRNRTKI